jgi:hypothetical protein
MKRRQYKPVIKFSGALQSDVAVMRDGTTYQIERNARPFISSEGKLIYGGGTWRRVGPKCRRTARNPAK